MEFKVYIERLLGATVCVTEWQGRKQLPLSIKHRFSNIYYGTISGVGVLFAEAGADKPLGNVKNIKVQIEKIHAMRSSPVVIVSPKIDRYQRDYLLSHKIPFAVPEKQLFLPFLGTYLQENFQPANNMKFFSPLTQVVFLYYLYSDRQYLYLSDTAKELGITQMSVSRAFTQLRDTGLFTEDRDNRKRRLKRNISKKELFERSKKYLINPISDVMYVNQDYILQNFLASGISALSHVSDLASPNIPCYAVDANSWKQNKFEFTDYLLDPDIQSRLEIWKYNPFILSSNNCVDPLSLFLSLADDPDERVEYALEKLLETIWKDDSVV